MRFIYILVNLITPVITLASSGSHEDTHHAITIPWSMVYPQIFNFALFAGLLIFFTRKNVVAYFSDRRAQFTAALSRAQAARAKAEAQRAELAQRLQTLEANAEDALAKAKAEAEGLKQNLLNEAQKLSQTLREDAARAAQHEIERAKTELREELLNESIKSAQAILSERLNEPDQRRLQTEFVDKIQVVR